ncbi:Heterokaryon incompatibility protein [Colletotrichum sp. SAR11_59]|uniref:Heterokaryon incompatibility protein n=1 Tax=Colletotrichum asianum TaxID=702518 RepID=A0A8H3W4B1_9PEZI|nr:heterokaryon incompatibility protein [Colletotrichum asianum]KAI8308279.1 Heterokaryon incompatibility protein [Colletotrichum sp. SAR11_59]
MWELQKAISTCKVLASAAKEAESLTISTQFQHVDRLLRFRQFRETPIRLINALILSQDAQCTNPRDRLYALKHLAVDGRDIVPFPNYGEDIDIVNRKTAWRLVRHHADGDMIVLPRHFKNTWWPQWHDPATWGDKRINDYLTGESRFVAERSDRRFGSRTIIKKWTATKDSRTYWTLLSNARLQVRSKRIGRITQCSATESEANDGGALGKLVRVRKYGARKVERLISLCWLLYDLLPNNKYKKAAKIKIGDATIF